MSTFDECLYELWDEILADGGLKHVAEYEVERARRFFRWVEARGLSTQYVLYMQAVGRKMREDAAEKAL